MKKIFKFTVWVVLIIAMIYGTMTAYEKIEKLIYPTDYADLVEKYAEENKLDKSLVFAVIKCESSFDKNAVSKIGAKGLMQITDETYEWICFKHGESINNANELFDPETNIKAGCRLLSRHLDEFKSVKTALAAYHAGRGITNTWLKDKRYSSDGVSLDKIPYSETEGYVDKVITTVEKYKTIYNIK